MYRYLLKRLGMGVLVLWAAFTLSFFLLQVLPGDSILIKFESPDLGLSPAEIHSLRLAYGANTPIWTQYVHSLCNIFRGDFGYSVQAGVPVTSLVASSLPGTLRLAVVGFFVAVIIAFGLALLANMNTFRGVRSLIQAIPAFFASVPAFWIGILLIQIFSFHLAWVPIINPTPLQSMILPALTVGIPISAPLAQIFLRSIDNVLTEPFVAVVRAKGASRFFTLWAHVLRNALLPVLNMAGLLLGELIAGAIVTETVFGLGGIGQLTQQAVNNQDMAVLQVIVLISALGFVLVNLAVDLIMPLLDPRLRATTGGGV